MAGSPRQPSLKQDGEPTCVPAGNFCKRFLPAAVCRRFYLTPFASAPPRDRT